MTRYLPDLGNGYSKCHLYDTDFCLLIAKAGLVAQAATDVLEVSSEAIETEVTSEVEETLLATQHTYRDRGSILQ